MNEITKFFETSKIVGERRTPECIYLAAPYSHPNARLVTERVEAVQHILGHIIVNYRDLRVIAPTYYTHRLVAENAVHPPDGWYHWDMDLLKRCDVMWVLKLDGWEDSTGIQLEVVTAIENDIPIFYLSAEEILDGKLP